MPLRLGIFGSSRADEIISRNPDITSWYICGHSLGGTAASMYTAENPDSISGIIFLGSYPYSDLRDYAGSVLTITAENDLILNQESYHESMSIYPGQANSMRYRAGTMPDSAATVTSRAMARLPSPGLNSTNRPQISFWIL